MSTGGGGDDYTPNFHNYNYVNYEFAADPGHNFVVPQISIDELTQMGLGYKAKNQLSPINQSIYDKFEEGSNRKSPVRQNYQIRRTMGETLQNSAQHSNHQASLNPIGLDMPTLVKVQVQGMVPGGIPNHRLDVSISPHSHQRNHANNSKGDSSSHTQTQYMFSQSPRATKLNNKIRQRSSINPGGAQSPVQNKDLLDWKLSSPKAPIPPLRAGSAMKMTPPMLHRDEDLNHQQEFEVAS